MEVSRLTLSDELKHQTATQTNILLWIQEHPRQCKNTNITKMAREMRSVTGSANTKKAIIRRMVDNQIITRFGTKFNSRFLINYMHRDIPQEVLENAPEEEKEHIRKIKKGLKHNQTLSPEGCVITKPNKQPEQTKETNMQTQSQPQVQTKVDKNKLTITINIQLGE